MSQKSEQVTTATAHNAPQLGHYELHPDRNIAYVAGDESTIALLSSLASALGWKVKRARKPKHDA
jgi:hypothetical protein